MKRYAVKLILIWNMLFLLPVLSLAQDTVSMSNLYTEYCVQARCTVTEIEGYEEYHNYIIDIEPCEDYGRDFQFRFNEHGIFNDYVKGKFKTDRQFVLPSQQFVYSDTTNITYFSGNGCFKNDSLFMNYYMASTTAYGALTCECKGVRLDLAMEPFVDHPAALWRLSPQPATNRVRAVCEATETGRQHGHWRLCDRTGKTLQAGHFVDGAFELSLAGCANGLYLVEIVSGDGAACRLKCIKTE